MAKPNEAKWFVSFEGPKRKPRATSVRATKTFPTEEEARLYAKQMVLADCKNVVAGTFLSPHHSTRRIISGRELHRWISGTDLVIE